MYRFARNILTINNSALNAISKATFADVSAVPKVSSILNFPFEPRPF